MSVIAGIIFLTSFIFVVDLPAKMARGEQAQKAIQTLNKTRQSFLAIEEVRTRLVKTSNPGLAEPELSRAANSARNLLIEYRKLVEFSPEVGNNVSELQVTFEEWVEEERHLIFDYKKVSLNQNKSLSTNNHIIKYLGIAEHGYLQTMNKLAEGEIPIHRYMDDGRWANHMMLISIGGFFLYLIGLMFLQQHLRRNELEERVKVRTSALNKKTDFLQILQSVTAKANETSSFDDVMQHALDQICDYTGWPVGHVYIQDKDDKQKMVPTDLWHLDDPDYSREFQRVTEETQFDPGTGLPGRVVETKQPAWISDVTKDQNFLRNDLTNNVRAAFAFPVISNLEVVVVMEFFSYEVQDEPEASQIDIVTHIGSQLGHMFGRLQAEKYLKLSEEQWRLTFDSTSDFISLLDRDKRFLRVNKSLADFLGVQVDEIIGQYCYDAFNCSERCRHYYASLATKNKAINEIIDDPIIGVPLHVTMSPIFDDTGSVSGYVHIARDVTEEREFEERLDHLAHYDHLTGLPNRTLFIDRIEQIIARSPWHDRIMGVLYLDLDRFKVINDTYGHDTGDLLLRNVAKRLKSVVREGDTITRLGGDEFAISLVDVAEKNDIALVASKINKILSEPFAINGKEIFITTSIGISLFPNDNDTIDGLLKYADVAMYGAKAKGKNTYLFYSPDINVPVSRQIDMEGDLRNALERDEFELWYQPRVDLYTGLISGMEALIRWRSKRFGLVQPDTFIPFLEETGLIVPVGEWVIQTACRQNKMWQDAGYPALRVSVNVSARQFVQNNLVENVCKSLSENGLQPKHLELEITESVLLEYMDEALSSLEEFDRLGIQLTIDDFGTGYSSLTYLKRFPIHALKIDKSFINDVTTNTNDAALAKAIISIAQSLELSVTAEGVETSEQLDFLVTNQCDHMQGYLYSKPLPVEDFEKLLQENHQLDLTNGEIKRAQAG